MPRIAEAIHVIERVGDNENLRRVQGSRTDWETGYWIVGKTTAESLLGGTVYVHRGQDAPSHAGGRIVGIYHEPGTDPKRRVIRFKAVSAAKNVLTGRQGWGYERKLIWRLDKNNEAQVVSDNDESAFPEGRKKYAMHHSRERDQAITRQAKKVRFQQTGKLECEVCDFDFSLAYGHRGDGFIEAHHRVPVAKLDGKTLTKLEDLSLVCSNCHRMLHRGNPLLTVEELRSMRRGADGQQ